MAKKKRRGSKSHAVPARPWSILVVNSEPALSEVVVRVLTAEEHQVARGTHEHDVVASLSSHFFHCCILDMHGGTGGDHLRMTNAIRGSESAQVANVPIVALADSYSSELFSWQNGVDDYIVRPFHARDLVQTVDASIGRSPSERTEHRLDGIERANERKTRAVPVVQAWQTFKL